MERCSYNRYNQLTLYHLFIVRFCVYFSMMQALYIYIEFRVHTCEHSKDIQRYKAFKVADCFCSVMKTHNYTPQSVFNGGEGRYIGITLSSCCQSVNPFTLSLHRGGRGFKPHQRPRCFLEQETLLLLLSTGWFQEQI